MSYADVPAAMKILHVVQERYPQLPVIVRTVDDTHMDGLREAGATEVVPEILEGSLMLASHALVLLGIPLNRVVKRIRLFREERYEMFKGYFHGLTDAESESRAKQQPRLHAVVMAGDAYAIGKRLSDFDFSKYAVEVKSLRRPSMQGEELTFDARLMDGDIIVLLGLPANLMKSENILLVGLQRP